MTPINILIIEEDNQTLETVGGVIEEAFSNIASISVISLDSFKRNFNTCPDVFSTETKSAQSIKSEGARVLRVTFNRTNDSEKYQEKLIQNRRSEVIELIRRTIYSIHQLNEKHQNVRFQ